jgi:hypothetical protein
VVETDSMQVAIGSIKDVVLDKDYWNNYGAIQK